METILQFHRDLTRYSNNDIRLMAKYQGLDGDLSDLRWLLAIRHSMNRGEMPGEKLEKLKNLYKTALKEVKDLDADNVPKFYREVLCKYATSMEDEDDIIQAIDEDKLPIEDLYGDGIAPDNVVVIGDYCLSRKDLVSLANVARYKTSKIKFPGVQGPYTGKLLEKDDLEKAGYDWRYLLGYNPNAREYNKQQIERFTYETTDKNPQIVMKLLQSGLDVSEITRLVISGLNNLSLLSEFKKLYSLTIKDSTFTNFIDISELPISDLFIKNSTFSLTGLPTTIEYLDLNNCITDLGDEALKTLTNLKVFIIKNIDITDLNKLPESDIVNIEIFNAPNLSDITRLGDYSLETGLSLKDVPNVSDISLLQDKSTERILLYNTGVGNEIVDIFNSLKPSQMDQLRIYLGSNPNITNLTGLNPDIIESFVINQEQYDNLDSASKEIIDTESQSRDELYPIIDEDYESHISI